MGPETGPFKKDVVGMVGKPDKMAARSALQLRSRAITSLLVHFELRRQFARPWWKALTTRLPSQRKCCFVVSQVPLLVMFADDVRVSAGPLLVWAG
jgi:hypothetical protein